MCEPQQNDTLGDVLEQEYFPFMYDRRLKLTAQEKALKVLFDGLDYSRFDASLARSARIQPRKMCIAVIYAFMNGVYTYRHMETFFQRNAFVISLFGLDASVDHSTISRFFTRNLDAFHGLFYQLVVRLDGQGELGRRMVALLQVAKGLKLIGDDVEIEEDNAVSLLQGLLETLSMMDLERDAPRGRGHRRDKVVKLEESAKDEMAKLTRMDNAIAGIGDRRNSWSRTDNDATFMRMKDDRMRNGQLKPAYIIQNAVDSGYVIACIASSDRNDYDTMEPMLREMEENLPWSYSQYCADSGYDSLRNHVLLEQKGIEDFIKPQDWEIGRRRRYINDIGRYQNMKYDEHKDEFTCANGRKLVFVKVTANRKHGTLSRHYACRRGCVTCPLRRQCMKTSRKKYKEFSAVIEHWQYNKTCYERLRSDRGIEVRLNRSIMVEGSFSQMKSNMGFDRFRHFSQKKILTIWMLLAMAMNTLHFASRRFGQTVSISPQWFSPPPEDASA